MWQEIQTAVLVICLISNANAEIARPYFNEPEAVYRAPPKYPDKEVFRGIAGGGIFVFSITKDSKTAHPTTLRSSARSFEDESLKAIRDYRFSEVPDSESEVIGREIIHINFEMERYTATSLKKFEKYDRRVRKQLAEQPINQNKLRKSIVKLSSVKGVPPYQLAHAQVMEFEYAKRFGTQDEQIEFLKNALIFVWPSQSRYEVINKLGATCIRNMILVQLELNRFGDALHAYEKLKAFDPALTADLDQTMDQIYSLITSDEPFQSKLIISSRGSTNSHLLKNRISVTEQAGHIEAIKLRCDKKYHEISSPVVEPFTIPASWGTCHAEFLGEPKTEFVLSQYRA